MILQNISIVLELSRNPSKLSRLFSERSSILKLEILSINFEANLRTRNPWSKYLEIANSRTTRYLLILVIPKLKGSLKAPKGNHGNQYIADCLIYSVIKEVLPILMQFNEKFNFFSEPV